MDHLNLTVSDYHDGDPTPALLQMAVMTIAARYGDISTDVRAAAAAMLGSVAAQILGCTPDSLGNWDVAGGGASRTLPTAVNHPSRDYVRGHVFTIYGDDMRGVQFETDSVWSDDGSRYRPGRIYRVSI